MGNIKRLGTKSATGKLTYRLASSPEYYTGNFNGGDYFEFNCPDYTHVSTASPYAIVWQDKDDVCQQIYPAGFWRTPSESDFQTLIASGYKRSTLHGIQGMLFGTKENTSESTCLFLPYAGVRKYLSTTMNDVASAGWYVSRTGTPANEVHFEGLRFDATTNPYVIGCDKRRGVNIRCIKK